jgi:hypothetical protein
MRYLATFLACTLCASTSTAHERGSALLADSFARVRPTSALGRRVVDTGVAGSATFRGLVQTLEDSDVIVYVDLKPSMDSAISGKLEFMGLGGTNRYLRITVSSLHHLNTIVSLLGHELQHAVEVAAAPDVTTPTRFATLYRRIGVPTGPDRYDSIAARTAGHNVQAELRGRGSESRLARHTDRDERLLDTDKGSIAMP